jgi:plasmid stability protein
MKNITLSLDDDTYRQARVTAEARNTTVSALVRDYLRTFVQPLGGQPDQAASLFAALDRVHDFRAADRLARDATHER